MLFVICNILLPISHNDSKEKRRKNSQHWLQIHFLLLLVSKTLMPNKNDFLQSNMPNSCY